MHLSSKLPNVGTTIFTVMSSLAQEHKAVNLSQGFPNFDPDARLRRLVFDHMEMGNNQYAPMPGTPLLRARIAEKIEHTYQGLQLNPDTEITVTAGATQALFCAFAAFIRPGDEVILIEPCYDSYRPSIETVGGVVVPYRLSAPDYSIDWEDVKKRITPKTKMICTNTPCNPTGKILSSEDLDQLAQLLRDSSIIHVSDEVYEHLVFDGQQHVSSLTHPELRKRSMAIYSFGKTFHTTGWKIGYLVAPPEITVEFRKVHQFNVFSANHPIQAALADYLADTSTYSDLNSFYQEKRDFFLNAIKSSRLRPLACEGTYFQLFDYSAISNENDLQFCKAMTKEIGVATIPVSAFFSNNQDDKVIRVCFAKTKEVLLDAAVRLCAL